MLEGYGVQPLVGSSNQPFEHSLCSMIEFAATRTNAAVEARLNNLTRRLVVARQAVTNLREEGEHVLADLMQVTIDRLNMEQLAWEQWRREGYRSPTLDRIRKAIDQADERSEQAQQSPVQR